MAQGQRLSRPAWMALAGAAALAAVGVARHVLKGPARPTVPGAAGPLAVDDGGHGGLPVLFVHSYAGTSAHWAAQLEHLRRSRRAVALNLRGHGGSAEPSDLDYTIPSLAQDIGAVADALGLERFVLVGHSMGGSAAAAYAAAHPERLAGLVLVGTPGRTAPEVEASVLAALEQDHHGVMENYWQTMTQGARDTVKPMLQADMRRIPRRASKALVAATFAYDPSAALNAFHGPALLIDTPHGDSPGALHLLAPQVRRECLSGTSHWPHLDDPRTFNRVLDGFLVKLDRPH
jgi:pimeloyl-ACP methyl ester carboxylesterase